MLEERLVLMTSHAPDTLVTAMLYRGCWLSLEIMGFIVVLIQSPQLRAKLTASLKSGPDLTSSEWDEACPEIATFQDGCRSDHKSVDSYLSKQFPSE